jgi:glycosyltransferase involved in cell wall biosynthesis
MSLVQVCLSPHPSLGGPALCYQQFQDCMQGRVIGISRHAEFRSESLVLPCDLHVSCSPGRFASRYYHCDADTRARVLAALEGATLVVMHGFYTHPFVWIGRHCLERGIPLVLVPHGMFDPWSERKSHVAKRLWRLLYGNRLLDGALFLLCATKAEQAKVHARFPRLRVECLHWACPPIPATSGSRENLRKQLGVGEGDRLCLSIGRLHPMKRPVELAAAFSRVAPSNLHLLFVGPEDGVTGAQIHAAISPAVRPRVHVLPPVYGAERFGLFRAADCYVSASSRENFNFTAAEALGCGLPVVLSQGNDLLGELQGGDFVFALGEDWEASLGVALSELASLSPEEARLRGSHARAWAEEHLSPGKFHAGLGSLLGLQAVPPSR